MQESELSLCLKNIIQLLIRKYINVLFNLVKQIYIDISNIRKKF